MTIPFGPLNLASSPLLSVVPKSPAIDPAIVVTTPALVILLIELFPVSATYTLPFLSNVIPNGLLKVAILPIASRRPANPEPARVTTSPYTFTMRIALLNLSATYKILFVLEIRPEGLLNLATELIPSLSTGASAVISSRDFPENVFI